MPSELPVIPVLPSLQKTFQISLPNVPNAGDAGGEYPLIVIDAVFVEHPLSPVTVYIVGFVGFAVTIFPLVELKPIAGDQV